MLAWGLAVTAQGMEVIANKAGELRWDVKGLSLAPLHADCPSSEAAGEDFWTLALESAPGFEGPDTFVLKSQTQPVPAVKRTRNGLEVVYDGLTDGKKAFGISLTLVVRGTEDAFEVGGEIRNGTKEWVVKGFTGPIFNGIRTELKRTPLLMPNGFGCRMSSLPDEGKEAWPWRKSGERLTATADYPSANGTMQWFAFAGETGGLYFGCHDARYGSKTLKVSYDGTRKTFDGLFQHRFFVLPGGRGAIPKVVVRPYAGDWHAAARFYRAWVDSVEKPIEKPAWVKTSTGWLLTILKQQNGEIVWPYGTLDQLGALAEERGLDTLGLFGWGYGGHDHLYPDYNPCPLMGGEKALREGIGKAHARGKKVILYANGYMMERGTAYWTATGKKLAVTGKDRETTVQEFWRKYSDTAGYHFDLACTVTRAWRERLLSLAMQANDFGADGILFDQLGGRGPMPCYAAGHGHPVPSMVYADDRKKMLHEIAATMKGVNPDFVIMTEGFFDALLDSITYFHGYLLGIFKDSAERIARQQTQPRTNGIFPEMVRYTYPETICTVRFPSPLIDRQMANYTCAYGWRLEIESRYAPDRDYLLSRVPPKVEDYGKIVEKPSVDLMRNLPFDATVNYMKRVAVFQKKNAALLMTGTFTDTEGFTCKGHSIVAKGYKSGNTFGVLLWNTADQPAAFTLNVPNAEWVSASEPETDRVEAFSELAPQTVRLLIWRSRQPVNEKQQAAK